MARLLDVDDLIAELEASCMPIHDKSLSGITGSTDTIADIINECAKEKEPALSANSTSSEVSKDTGSTDMGQSYQVMLEVKEELTRIENGGDGNEH